MSVDSPGIVVASFGKRCRTAQAASTFRAASAGSPGRSATAATQKQQQQVSRRKRCTRPLAQFLEVPGHDRQHPLPRIQHLDDQTWTSRRCSGRIALHLSTRRWPCHRVLPHLLKLRHLQHSHHSTTLPRLALAPCSLEFTLTTNRCRSTELANCKDPDCLGWRVWCVGPCP